MSTEIKQRPIQQIEVKKLKLNPKNPRKNDEAVDTVAKSIEKFGFNVPLFCDTSLTVYCGNTRLKAARKLKLKTVPCIIADDLTADEIREYALIDNKSAELAEWDAELLEAELAELDMSEWGIVDWTTGGGCLTEEEDSTVIEDEPPEPDEQGEPTVRLGEIWQLGRHRLICGDSTNAETVARLMDGKQADLCVTDPPYNVDYEGGTEKHLKIENDKMSPEEFREFLTAAFDRVNETLTEGSAFYVWFASREHVNFEKALNAAGLQVRQELIWVKSAFVLGRQDYQWKHEPCLYGWKEGAAHKWYGGRKQTTTLEFERPNANKEHPTMKPISLIANCIANSSKKGNIVIDLFGGSGSTLIACEQLGRKCYTAELDPRYCDVIIKRWENLTGQTAVKLSITE